MDKNTEQSKLFTDWLTARNLLIIWSNQDINNMYISPSSEKDLPRDTDLDVYTKLLKIDRNELRSLGIMEGFALADGQKMIEYVQRELNLDK